MVDDTYNPERDITPVYLATVTRWIQSTGEVFVVMRYLRAAGSKDYAFLETSAAFHRLVALCPTGTDIIAFRDRPLTIRGHVTDEFIRDAYSQIADGTEYLCVSLSTQSPGDPRLSGRIGDNRSDLTEDLDNVRGQPVALGPCPRFIDADNDSMISAAKGGIDGPR
jgi:hypothetical protein